MKKLFYSFSDFLKSFISILKIIYSSHFFNLRRLKKIKIEKSKVCILGNGPTLQITIKKYKTELSKMQLLAVNNMAVADIFSELKPQYYIMPAQTYFLPDEELSNLYIDYNNKIFENLTSKVGWNMTLFVPFYAKPSKRLQKLLSENQFISIHYYNPTPIEGNARISHFLFSKALGMPRPHNVVIPSLMNLILLGYKEIYIVGADHSWLKEISVNERNEALVDQKHFYDEGQTKPMKMQDRSQARKLHEIIEKFYLSFRAYWEIKSFAEKNNVRIYNASEESMIDAFERKKLPTV